MRTTVYWALMLGVLGLFLMGGGGCVSSQEADQEQDNDRDPSPETAGPDLAPQREAVRTVQFYRGDDERRMPVTSLRSPETLTLEFDLIERQGRPLSVYFEHANRDWERDLSPSQVLESYQNDKLVEYRSSQGTEVSYVHYSYRLPNDDIRFRLSGNYILRVTEEGRRDSVLFERPFFVTDEQGHLEMGAEALRIPGQRQESLRPVARYGPPGELRGDPFGYVACFVRNGRLSDTRCQDRPRLAQQPQLQFELERTRAFAPTTADYTVNLGNLRSSEAVERLDRSVSPFWVLLKPDYAQFSGRNVDSFLNGQIVIREAIRGRSNPSLTAEYVRTTFAFVPPKEQPIAGGLVVAGSFSGMDAARGRTMKWREKRSRYEGEVLLKQGHYQYFYAAEDPRFRNVLRRSQPRRESTYTTFVYYEDPSESTDRLLRVRTFQQ